MHFVFGLSIVRSVMASLASQLRRATVELAHFEKQLAKLEARTAGKRVEVARLQNAIARGHTDTNGAARSKKRKRRAPVSDLPPQRTDAILAVLVGERRPMSPSE